MEQEKSQFPPYILDIVIQVIMFRWKNAVLLPICDYYDEVLIYKDVDALLDWQKRKNTMILIKATDDFLDITVDSSKDPETTEILKEVRRYVEVAFGWNICCRSTAGSAHSW